MASTSCPACGAWTVGFEFDLDTGTIVWYCLACRHRWQRQTDDPVNVPKLLLQGAAVIGGTIGLGALVVVVIVDRAFKRAGWA